MPKACHNCHAEWNSRFSPGFREECPQCGEALHCCRNCRFFDAGAYQWCREPQARAERPRAPEIANLCDFFQFTAAPPDAKPRPGDEPANARGRGDAMPAWMRFEKPKRDIFADGESDRPPARGRRRDAQPPGS